MPELPEVETVVRGLRASLPGRTILDVRLGKSDFVVPNGRSDHLASLFKDPLIIRHSGGHVVPSDPQVRNSVATFLQERARDADQAYGNATRNG